MLLWLLHSRESVRDGVGDHLESDHAVALEVVCLMVLDHERQVVVQEAPPLVLLPNGKAVGRLPARTDSGCEFSRFEQACQHAIRVIYSRIKRQASESSGSKWKYENVPWNRSGYGKTQREAPHDNRPGFRLDDIATQRCTDVFSAFDTEAGPTSRGE